MADTAIAYSDSGAGKTSICVSIAKWVYELYGLTTRLISVEGWEPVANEGLIQAGIVSAFNVSSQPSLLSAMRKLSRGYWPKIQEEEVPTLDGNGIVIGSTKKKVRRIVEDKNELAKVGLYFVETADGIADAFMRHIIKEETIEEDDRGKLRVKSIGPQGSSGRYEEDGEVFGGNSEGHYNIVQVEMHNLFTAFSGLGGNVKLVFWTSHVGTGKTKRTGETCFCPLLVGEAKNALVPSWVGECFHLEDIPLVMDENGQVIQQKQVRAFYENHRENGIMEGPQYRCKSRVGPSDIDALHEQFPGGFINLGVGKGEGLDQYYRWLQKRKGESASEMKKWKEEIDASRRTA
jgi:hypothetical protein